MFRLSHHEVANRDKGGFMILRTIRLGHIIQSLVKYRIQFNEGALIRFTFYFDDITSARFNGKPSFRQPQDTLYVHSPILPRAF